MDSTLNQKGWHKSASSDIVPRFGFSAECIAASTTVSQGPGWNAIIEGTHEVSSELRIRFHSHAKH